MRAIYGHLLNKVSQRPRVLPDIFLQKVQERPIYLFWMFLNELLCAMGLENNGIMMCLFKKLTCCDFDRIAELDSRWPPTCAHGIDPPKPILATALSPFYKKSPFNSHWKDIGINLEIWTHLSQWSTFPPTTYLPWPRTMSWKVFSFFKQFTWRVGKY